MLKPRFIFKLGLLVICMLLLGPYLFHLKLTEDREDDGEEYHLWQMKQRARLKEEASNKYVRSFHIDAESSHITSHETLTELAVLKHGVPGNFEPAKSEVKFRPGENGEPVELTASEKVHADRTVNEFGFNMVASDKVAMDRTVPDTRLTECQFWHYPDKQPRASVILVFHNEGFSTLVRTIHSIINTSPLQFLAEVVLVDDFSDKNHLKLQLNDYIREEFGDIVKLYHNQQREGLIRSRTRGAHLATGEVIIFLDAHCECNRNWLVPLLDRIRLNRKTLAVPVIDGIDWNTLAYTSIYDRQHYRGIFEWGFFYKETKVPEPELARRKYESEPYRSPTHAGGLFAIDRKYFLELGGYDPGLRIWGGENYELSFKIWQCGGTVEWVPCSRVGHIYRNHMPYSLGNGIDPNMSPIYINYMRVVEVWLDEEYKEYFYTREPSFRGYPFGNISQQIEFKKQHNCRSFHWFMENVAYDVFQQFPKPPPNKAWGEIRELGTNFCWDAGSVEVGANPVRLRPCRGVGYSQQFRLNIQGQIGIGERCIHAQNDDTLHVSLCAAQPTGPWEWSQVSGLIQHRKLKKCVDVGTDSRLQLRLCNVSSPTQKWNILQVFPWKKS